MERRLDQMRTEMKISPDFYAELASLNEELASNTLMGLRIGGELIRDEVISSYDDLMQLYPKPASNVSCSLQCIT